MSQRALFVGVNDYAFNPLTAPAKDARDMRDALVAAGAFAPAETRLLIDDGTGAGVDGPASRDSILNFLQPLYGGEECKRLFFYFSGHGASWRVSSGASVIKPVLLCHGVNSFSDDGGAMIDVDELLERFRLRGPEEQIWVIDACRNIPQSDGRPVVAPTTWGDKDPIAERRRALVYAVAPLAQAAAIQGANSVFTREFLEGLAGKGRAAIYDAGSDAWAVTHLSICEYARALLEDGMADWEKAFKLPRVEFESDPPPGPLRMLPEASAPKARGVALKVEPAGASGAVSAKLKREGSTPAQWPPHQSSSALPPAVYRFEAQLAEDPAWDSLSPSIALIDTRETDEIEVRVRPRLPSPGFAKGDALRSQRQTRPTPGLIEIGRRTKRKKTARLEIETGERAVQFSATLHGAAAAPAEIVSDHVWISPNIWGVAATLPPGLWRIEARLAEEKLGMLDVDLAPGSIVKLRLIASLPEALRDVMWGPGARVEPSAAAPALIVAERMGPIQGAVLPSVLPLLALKPFDIQAILPNLGTPWLSRVEMDAGKAPLSVAVALDGDWGALPAPNLGAMSLRVGGHPVAASLFTDGRELAVLAAAHIPGEASGAAREIPGDNLATLRVPAWGSLEFAMPRVPNRVACIGVTLRAGGRFELSVASLAPKAGLGGHHTRSETARAVAIGARLLGTGASDEEAIRQAAHGKWIDPVLGVLAWHAIGEQDANWRRGRETIARNMFAAFPSLADSLLLLGWLGGRDLDGGPSTPRSMLEHARRQVNDSFLRNLPDVTDQGMESLLAFLRHEFDRWLPPDAHDPGRRWRPRHLAAAFADQPVLAPSIDMLADMAEAAGLGDHWASRRRALIEPGAVWNAVYFSDGERDDA